MQMIERKQSYEFVRSVFERYHDWQRPEILWPLCDWMAQSSTDIGPEASIPIQWYITEVERKPASINQATKIYNERNWMGAVWVLYSHTKLSAEQRLSEEGDDRTGIATPTAINYRTGSAGTKHREIHSLIEKKMTITAPSQAVSGRKQVPGRWTL